MVVLTPFTATWLFIASALALTTSSTLLWWIYDLARLAPTPFDRPPP